METNQMLLIAGVLLLIGVAVFFLFMGGDAKCSDMKEGDCTKSENCEWSGDNNECSEKACGNIEYDKCPTSRCDKKTTEAVAATCTVNDTGRAASPVKTASDCVVNGTGTDCVDTTNCTFTNGTLATNECVAKGNGNGFVLGRARQQRMRQARQARRQKERFVLGRQQQRQRQQQRLRQQRQRQQTGMRRQRV